MKKVFALILLICLCIGSAGCSSKQESYKSAELPSSVHTDYLSPKSLSSSVGNATYVKENMPDRSFEIGGEKYLGKYKHTAYTYDGFLRVDYYLANGTDVQFAFFEDTDTLAYFNQTIEPLNEESLLEIKDINLMAYEIAKDYATDISSYEIEQSSIPRILGTNSGYYANEYTFAKRAQGYSTTDFIYVIITYSGKIETLSVGQIGAFDECPQTDGAEISLSIDRELSTRYEINGAKIIDKIYFGQKLVQQNDGRIVLISSLQLCMENADGVRSIIPSTVATPIDKNGYPPLTVTRLSDSNAYTLCAQEAHIFIRSTLGELWQKSSKDMATRAEYELCLYGIKLGYSSDGYLIDETGNCIELSEYSRKQISDFLTDSFA